LKEADEIGEGEFIRTGANSHARVRVFEGSQVEMNQRAELAVSASRRDTTIHLDQGSIIVQAAKRHTGHLYVRAPDCTVAVTGTVFSVNSGTKGSAAWPLIEGKCMLNTRDRNRFCTRVIWWRQRRALAWYPSAKRLDGAETSITNWHCLRNSQSFARNWRNPDAGSAL